MSSSPSPPPPGRPRVDTSSPEYRMGVYKVSLIVAALGLFGGSCLGWRIHRAETLAEERRAAAEASPTPGASPQKRPPVGRTP